MSKVPFPNSQWLVQTTMEILGMDSEEFAASTLTPRGILETILRGDSEANNHTIMRISKLTGINYHLGRYLSDEDTDDVKDAYPGLRETIKESYKKTLMRTFKKEEFTANM